jgi:hypothetical protein
MNLKTLSLYANIVDLLCEKKINTATSMLTGYVTLNKELLESLQVLNKNGLCSGSIGFYDDNDLVVDAVFAEITEKYFPYRALIELTTKKEHAKFFICDNWNTLLSYETYVKSPVEAVYFIDDNQLLTLDDNNTTFNNYQNVARVYQLLESVAIKSSGTPNLVVYERALQLKYKLKKSNLDHEFDTEALDRFLDKELHYEAKVSLVCKALVSFLSEISDDLRFGHLISHFNAFSMDLSLSYQNYVDDYTFDKVRKEYQEKKTLYIEKVHDIFDRAVTKLLSIPAGVWFANTQIQSYTLGSLEFYKNIAVLVSVFILSGLLILNLLGQNSVLSSLSDEYNGLFERLKSDYQQEESNISAALIEIKNKAFWVYLKLGFSLLSVLLLLALTILLMVKAAI